MHINQVAASLSDEIPDPERQQIHEMSSLLHNALASCDGDISPFQQVIEQLFASLPGHRFKISVNWIRSSSTTAAVVKSSDFSMDPLLRESTYLQHLQDLSDPSAAPERVVAVLTEAEVFQDSKDIKRDELIINGEYVAGTVGYSAIVDSLQRQIHGVLKEQVGKQDVVVAGDQPHAFTETTRDIAKQILNVSLLSCGRLLCEPTSNDCCDCLVSRLTRPAIVPSLGAARMRSWASSSPTTRWTPC